MALVSFSNSDVVDSADVDVVRFRLDRMGAERETP